MAKTTVTPSLSPAATIDMDVMCAACTHLTDDDAVGFAALLHAVGSKYQAVCISDSRHATTLTVDGTEITSVTGAAWLLGVIDHMAATGHVTLQAYDKGRGYADHLVQVTCHTKTGLLLPVIRVIPTDDDDTERVDACLAAARQLVKAVKLRRLRRDRHAA